MSWIKAIDPDEALGKLKESYRRVSTPYKRVDNILIAHSLRPGTQRYNKPYQLIFRYWQIFSMALGASEFVPIACSKKMYRLTLLICYSISWHRYANARFLAAYLRQLM